MSTKLCSPEPSFVLFQTSRNAEKNFEEEETNSMVELLEIKRVSQGCDRLRNENMLLYRINEKVRMDPLEMEAVQ